MAMKTNEMMIPKHIVTILSIKIIFLGPFFHKIIPKIRTNVVPIHQDIVNPANIANPMEANDRAKGRRFAPSRS